MSRILRFDRFEVDLASGRILKNGLRIHLREQCFQILASLLERPGEVVTRDDLRRRLWADDVNVDFDNNLNRAVATLREALGDSADRPRFVETLPKRGYRFLAEVSDDIASSGADHSSRGRVVVLPFVNLSGDSAQEYFSDAMTEEIITELASIAPDLGVIARTTAMRYKNTHKDVTRIGSELRVQHIVEGGVRRDGDRVGITVQLIRVHDQTHLFARRYDADLRNVFEMRSCIASALAECLMPATAIRVGTASARRTRTPGRPTEDLTAYNEYIQGRHLLERGTPATLMTAKQHFENAIARDSAFALAHDALAELYTYVGYLGYTRPKDAFCIGISHALAAVERDESLAEAHAVLAEYHKQLDYNWPSAERQMARALQLNPSSPTVRLRHAMAVLMPHNRLDEAAAEIERALESDPFSPLAQTWLGVTLLLARDFDRAIVEGTRLLEIEPNSPWAHFIIGIAYRQQYVDALAAHHIEPDLASKAIRELQIAIDLSPGSVFFHGWLGHALGVCGREAEARAVLQQLHRSSQYVLPTSFGFVHLALGELDAAFEWFDRAVEERDQIMMPISSYAHFDPIRSDPRFAALMRKMKLA